MRDQRPENDPGHLDIDAVSAFIDRDFAMDDLATIGIHLSQCPACQREVVEIRTTVILLAALPQYAPRRSFCLGHEYARARRRAAARELPWPAAALPARAGPMAGMPPAGAGRYAGWLPGLQAAAVVVGALLLLVTASDLFTNPASPQAWFFAPVATVVPTALAESAPAPRPAPATTGDSSASEPVSSFALNAARPDAAGTTSEARASQGVVADEASSAPALTATAALAVVTHAAPVPAARDATDAERAPAGANGSTRLRLVQIALAFALVWLVVSIVGLRRIRA